MIPYFYRSMHNNRLTFLFVIILVVFSLWAMKALFHPGFYTSHDGWHQVARLYHYDQAIRAGQFPPRYSFNLLYGFGYPLFTFSYHLPWLFAEPFILSGFSIFTAIKLVFIVGFVGSGVVMFFWLKNTFNLLSGFVGAFLYLWAPYRFSNIFVRAAIGEATSFVFMPLFFYGLCTTKLEKNSIPLVIGALGLTGIILSHTMMLYILVVPVIVYCSLKLYVQKRNRFQYLAYWFKTIVLGLLLSSFYFLPAVYYKNITIFDSVQKLFFQQQFVTLRQLIYMPWGYSAAFTGVGEMSLQLGITQWLIFVVTLIILGWGIMKKKKLELKTEKQIISITFFASFLLSIFIMNPLAKPIWKQISTSATIDFPWRFLALSVFSCAVMGSFVVYFLPKKYRYLVITIIIGIGLYVNRNHLKVNQYTDVPLSLYIASEKTTNTFDEYLPKYTQTGEVNNENRKPFTVDSEKATIKDYTQKVNEINFTFDAAYVTQLKVNAIYFPGMHLFVNNKEQTIKYQDTGFPQLELPIGQGTVQLLIKESKIGKIGNLISLVTIFYILLLLGKMRYGKKL